MNFKNIYATDITDNQLLYVRKENRNDFLNLSPILITIYS